MDRRKYSDPVKMPHDRLNKTYNQTIGITIVCWTIVMLFTFSSCSSRKKELAGAILERDSLPGMKTTGVTTLVSDSGITRYRVTTEEWLIFDKKNPPYWAFEKGVYLEKFDSLYRVDASIKADTAYYYERKKLWELKGHVSVRSIKGEKFDTQQLFWDQNTEKVYSDQFIRIEQEDKIITGYGFESNQQMTKYVIRNTEGIFPVSDQPKDSVQSGPKN